MAQLTKLDASTKFIETLPKRGYRWVEPVLPLSIETSVGTGFEFKPHAQVVRDSAISTIPIVTFETVASCFLFALLLAFVMMWLLSRPTLSQFGLAILPAVAEQSHTKSIAKELDDDLLWVLRNNPRIKLVSRAAIDARPQNPFPYFSEEFDVEWVLESRISDHDVGWRIELGLVDARSGLEVRTINFEAANNTEMLMKLAKNSM